MAIQISQFFFKEINKGFFSDFFGFHWNFLPSTEASHVKVEQSVPCLLMECSTMDKVEFQELGRAARAKLQRE